MAAGKQIQLVFKTGVEMKVAYGYKAFEELKEKMGKDGRVDYKDFSVSTKDIVAVNFIPAQTEEA